MNGQGATGSAVKELLDSVITSGLPAEEALRRLDRFGIDWYLTQQGDLMIRYWQVGAEDLIAPERVATIRMGRSTPRDASALEWVSGNLDELRGQYEGQWIAVANAQVIASAASLPELLQQVEQAGVQQPFVTQIPAGAVVWNMTYAG